MALTGADLIKNAFKIRLKGIVRCRDQCVKPLTQSNFFVAFAIIPWAPLKPHFNDIVPNEMRARARLQQATIGFVGTKLTKLFCRVNTCAFAGLVHSGAKIAN
jgi:hypothetical protein